MFDDDYEDRMHDIRTDEAAEEKPVSDAAQIIAAHPREHSMSGSAVLPGCWCGWIGEPLHDGFAPWDRDGRASDEADRLHAAHVLAVLSETHAVVELPEPERDQDGRHAYELTEPRRGVPPVLCNTCAEEIEAWRGVSIHGMVAGYDWRHVSDRSTACVPEPRRVRPYDSFDAERALEARVAEGGGSRG